MPSLAKMASNSGQAASENLLMVVYALTSSQISGETLDLFLTRDAAEAELREILQDEPTWVDVLSVVPIDLNEQETSQN
jgi:hypothetical protein